MTRIVNNEKERARIYLATSVRNDLSILNEIEGKVKEALSALHGQLIGFPSGIDQNVRAVLERTKKHCDDIRRALKLADDTIGQLDVTDEVGD